MEHLLLFIFSFLLIYLLYLFIIVIRKKGLKKFKKSKQLDYFRVKFNLNVDKINFKSFANAFALTNAFIISFAFTISDFFNNLILKLLVGFLLLVPLMLILYNFLGKYYKKKEVK